MRLLSVDTIIHDHTMSATAFKKQ